MLFNPVSEILIMAQVFNSKLSATAYDYAKALLVPVTKTTLKQSIEEHPFYPSLYSLSNVFERYGISSEAYKIEDAELHELPVPFIAYVNTKDAGKDFALVTNTDNGLVNYRYNNKPVTVSHSEFIKLWEKIAFIAEPSAKSGEANYTLNKQKEKQQLRKTSLLIAGSFLVFLLLVLQSINISLPGMTITALSMLFIKLAGIASTVLLLFYDIDKTNSFIKNICSAGKQTSCDAVLHSKASKIAGLSWGEIGFFYFASATLFLLFPTIGFDVKTSFLSIAASFAAFYIPFSIYYQWKVVKKWCMLCLWVQAVLVLEIIWAVFSFWVHPVFYPLTFTIVTATAISILLPAIAWFSIKPLLKNAKEKNTYKAAYKRLLYNPDIFQGFLSQQADAAPGYENLGITLGNPDASTTIIKVCNPYCGPCANAHPVLEEILQHNNDVKLKIIFTSTNDENDKGGTVVKHLLAVAEKNDAQTTQQALDDWYLADKKEYDLFAAKYPMNGEVKKQSDKVEAMRKWCNESDVQYTPTIFINGKRLPENYSIQELKYILL